MNTKELKLKFASALVSRHGEDLDRLGFTPNSRVEQIFSRIDSDSGKYQKEYNDLYSRKQDNHYGVLSMSKYWDSLLLWAHYACCHKGYCIGFSEEVLRESNKFGRGGEVIYSDDFPQLMPDLDGQNRMTEKRIIQAYVETHTKNRQWQYEGEYRLSSILMKHERPATLQERLVKYPDDAVIEVLLGCQISKNHKEEIISICREKRIKVFQTMPLPFKFKLDKYTV